MNHVPDGPMDRILKVLEKGPRSSGALQQDTQLERVVMHKKLDLLRKQNRLMTSRVHMKGGVVLVCYELKT